MPTPPLRSLPTVSGTIFVFTSIFCGLDVVFVRQRGIIPPIYHYFIVLSFLCRLWDYSKGRDYLDGYPVQLSSFQRLFHNYREPLPRGGPLPLPSLQHSVRPREQRFHLFLYQRAATPHGVYANHFYHTQLLHG